MPSHPDRVRRNYDPPREVTWGDIERCPFAPREAGYEAWSARDNARLQRIVDGDVPQYGHTMK